MSEVSSTYTASSIQMDYMKLLVTQLQNQNPLEPLDNNEMASQLAQFSELSQLEQMNSSFANVLKNVERTYANSLIGKVVSFKAKTEEGQEVQSGGVVGQVYNNVDGKIVLTVGNSIVNLEDIVSVSG